MISFTNSQLEAAVKFIRSSLKEVELELKSKHGKIVHEQKQDRSTLTELDTKVEHHIRDALYKFDSSIPFVGEETGGHFKHDTHWLVDSIDGTSIAPKKQNQHITTVVFEL